MRPVCARCRARMYSCVEPVTGELLVDCGVGPVSAKGHQYVTEEIVGISHTLVVGGELNQHKNGRSLSPLVLVFRV